MNLNALTRPLSIDEIDFRVQSVNNGGYAIILAYKDARADMIRLDEAVGPLGWKREHSNGNANCTVSLFDKENNQWVSKEDTGAESYSDKEKGLASDSFKRACFNWGIGRELYDYPLISIKLLDSEITEKQGKKTANWNFKPKEWTWFSQFDEDGRLSYLACKDSNNKKRFAWGEFRDDLKQQESQTKVSDSEPSEDTTKRGTSDEEEAGNVNGLIKQSAEPIESNEESKEMSKEDVRWHELAQKYEIMFGKKPRANTRIETLEEKIAEETARKQANTPTSNGAIYSDAGTTSNEDEDTEHVDPYSEFESTMTEELIHEPEEVDPMEVYITEIDGHKDRASFVVWAKGVVSEMKGKVDDSSIEDFQKQCNLHYQKIG